MCNHLREYKAKPHWDGFSRGAGRSAAGADLRLSTDICKHSLTLNCTRPRGPRLRVSSFDLARNVSRSAAKRHVGRCCAEALSRHRCGRLGMRGRAGLGRLRLACGLRPRVVGPCGGFWPEPYVTAAPVQPTFHVDQGPTYRAVLVGGPPRSGRMDPRRSHPGGIRPAITGMGSTIRSIDPHNRSPVHLCCPTSNQARPPGKRLRRAQVLRHSTRSGS